MDTVQEISDALAREAEQLSAGDKLPSEHALMSRFGVSRATVRRAIDRLEARFLVRRVQGSGTFVNRRLDYVISAGQTPSLHGTVERAGSRVNTFPISSEKTLAPDDVRMSLALDADAQVTHLKRLAYIDDNVATCAEEWIAPGVADDIDVSLKVIESLSEVLRGLRKDPVRAWSRVSIDFPPTDVAARLELPSEALTWVLETFTRDRRTSEPLMFSRAWMRQDRIRVQIEFGETS